VAENGQQKLETGRVARKTMKRSRPHFEQPGEGEKRGVGIRRPGEKNQEPVLNSGRKIGR